MLLVWNYARHTVITLAVTAALTGPLSAFSQDNSTTTTPLFLRGTVYEQAADRYDLDPLLLYAVSLVESAAGTEIRSYTAPSIYAIRGPKGSYYPETYAEAKARLDQQIERYGVKKLDAGLMQINGQHWQRFEDLYDVLDPLENVTLGAEILREAMDSYPDDELIGIGRYHSYTPARARTYGKRVLTVFNNLKELEQ